MRPRVAATAASKVHSLLDVGLLSGMMMGRGFSSAMACSTSPEKAPATVLTPMSTVGLICGGGAASAGWAG